MSEQVVRLSIAGLGVSIDCDNPWLSNELSQRYRSFLGAEATLNAHIQWKSAEQPFQHPGMSFLDHVLYFHAPGYQGYIDIQRAAAELSLSSAHPVESIEYFLRAVYALLAFRAGGMMVHGAGVLHREQAYLFVGFSGAGKTTVARLSSPEHVVLNDDLVVLLPWGKGWGAYGTPFWNPTQVYPSAQSGGLKSVLFLIQDKQVYLEPVKPGLALADLVTKIPVIPLDREINALLLARLLRLLKTIPAYRLHFLPENTFWTAIDAV